MAKSGQKMGEKASAMMDKMFKMSDIKTQIGVKISQFEEDGIVFEDGTKVDSDLTMFISVGTGHSILNPKYALEIIHLLQSISTWAFTKNHRLTFGLTSNFLQTPMH